MFTMAVATTDTIEQGKVFHQYEASCEFIALTMAVATVPFSSSLLLISEFPITSIQISSMASNYMGKLGDVDERCDNFTLFGVLMWKSGDVISFVD